MLAHDSSQSDDPAPEGLRVERSGAVTTIVIDRPSRRNALALAHWDALPGLVAAADQDPGTRVLVVRSASPDVFSAGADIDEYRAGAGDPDWARRSQSAVSAALAALRGCAMPTVAVVRGTCIGGGVGIALACDLRVVDTTAVFRIPPARLGLVFPFEDTRHLVALVGPAQARLLLFTARDLDAREAHRIGFVETLVAPDDLDAAVDDLLATLASVSQTSVRAMKANIVRVLDGQVHEDDRTRALAEDAVTGADHAEGVAAFLERRAPRFPSA